MHNKGYTLIEITLYVAFATMALLASGAFMLSVLSSKSQLLAAANVAQNASFSLKHITEEIRGADLVVTPISGADGATLVLYNQKKNETVTLREENGRMLMETASTSSFLTANSVVVTSLHFQHVGYAGSPDTIRMSVTLAARDQSGSQRDDQETFVTTAMLRAEQ